MFITPIAALVLLIPGILSAPSPLRDVKKVDGVKRSRGYIVTLKDGAPRDRLVAELGPAVSAVWNPDFINGFAGTFNETLLNIVRAHPDVASITETGTGKAAGFRLENAPASLLRRVPEAQTDAPWGLQRISSSAPIGDTDPWTPKYNYRYESIAQGEGVDVYVMDSGINLIHNDFEGRATWGATFGPGFVDADGLGHGTHVAGTIAGKTSGVAKKSHVIAVKVLSDQDLVYWDDLITGLNWVVAQSKLTGRPTVINISLQGGGYSVLDEAITAVVNEGIHVVICAGNYNTDISTVSPARAPGGIAVGAMNIEDWRASFSNYGPGVKIFAPGEIVRSTYINGADAFAYYSGTSMSAPHVAGLIASIISDNGNMSPAAMITYLQSTAISGVLTDIPAGTPNLLANNGFTV